MPLNVNMFWEPENPQITKFLKSKCVKKTKKDFYFTKQNPCKMLDAVLNAIQILNPLLLTTTSGVKNRPIL